MRTFVPISAKKKCEQITMYLNYDKTGPKVPVRQMDSQNCYYWAPTKWQEPKNTKYPRNKERQIV